MMDEYVLKLLAFLDLEDLRLDTLDGLAHLCTQAELTDGEFLECHEMLFHYTENRCESPTLMLRILSSHITPLPFEGIHAEVRDHGTAEADQRIIPMASLFDRE